MRYKNAKTGAVINSPCFIKGGDWIAESTLDGLTLKELKALAAETGVKISGKSSKDEIKSALEKHLHR